MLPDTTTWLSCPVLSHLKLGQHADFWCLPSSHAFTYLCTERCITENTTGNMQGGDLNNALRMNLAAPELSWYNRGARIALDIIKGLHFLHSHNVSLGSAITLVPSAALYHSAATASTPASSPNWYTHRSIHFSLTPCCMSNTYKTMTACGTLKWAASDATALCLNW